MSITLTALHKQRADTAANWTSANPTLLSGELGFESDTGKMKLGNGSTAWNSLAYLILIPSSGVYPGTQLLMPFGTASVPSLSFDGDTNLGIYRSAADTFAISTNGSGRLFVNSSGLVGIGTSSPAQTLDVNGTVNFKPAAGYNALFQQSSTSLRINYLNDAGSANVSAAYRATSFEWQKGDGGPVVNIDSSGRLGIGTTTVNAKLEISGNSGGRGLRLSEPSGEELDISAGAAANDPARIATSAGSGIAFAVNGTAGENARLDSAGRWLLGTSSNSNLSTACFAKRSDGAESAWVYLQTTAGSPNNGDTIGSLVFNSTGNTGVNGSAYIICQRDGGTWTNTTSMPGRLVFSVTADGAASPTERFRITNDGVRTYNQSTSVAVNATATMTVADLKNGIITSTTAAAVNATLPTGTNTEAGFSGVYTNMTFEWSVINTGANTFTVLANGASHVTVGNMAVAANTSGRFASRRTAANTFVCYRLS